DNLPFGEQPWTVIIGAGGGNLRCAVATRLPMQPVAELDKLSFPNDANRTTRHAAGLITYNNHTLLATSVHLRCCGSADSREEEARLIETGALQRRPYATH
ncbi:MAG: hypothetical protein HC809_15530, partial [Gammaproteobacteria bacterium]|nr:hypothetical protein [Gammaproteobacteria bacterium]